MLTYVSLFSSAGVGCFGFKKEGFNCVATNELIERRINVQKFNKKCKYESGYICGDITQDTTKKLLLDQIELWKKVEKMKRLDVLIATPPCQGMSVANHKKSDTEIIRNSLVVESIKMIKLLNPRFFVFENVPAFMKTICTDIDGIDKSISESIQLNLGDSYSYVSKIINFKNYGACSSRQRTVVIGVSKDYANDISPYELFPIFVDEKTLRQVIGHLPSLTEMGEIDKNDFYHSFRSYPVHMRDWISCLSEGESAFDNEDDLKKPHQIIDGKIVINKQKNGDKYKRQFWDKVGPCIHTRNDQLASQNTIHPQDDRVFSIRELMLMMTVPTDFKWVEYDLNELNMLSLVQKKALLKKEEIKIRQSLGEAVPTAIFQSIAHKIKNVLSFDPIKTSQINRIVEENNFSDVNELITFIQDNPLNLSVATLSRIAELSNTKRTDNAAYFTSKPLITEMMKQLPDIQGDEISIIEPSVGVGNFVPLIVKRYEGQKITLDLVDIDCDSILVLKALLDKYDIPKNCTINFISDDFLLHNFQKKYDLAVGNPPFFKISSQSKIIETYLKDAINKKTSNICSFFLDKAINIAKYVCFVFPKFLLNTPEFADSRKYLAKKCVDSIIDFGEKGFPGVLVETIAIFVNNQRNPKYTNVFSVTKQLKVLQEQQYIFDEKFPYWIIYRNAMFDNVFEKLEFDMFTVFRDRQLTNSYLSSTGDVRVLKSRNISDDGRRVIDIPEYDSFTSLSHAEKISVFTFMDRDDVYLTPNMTYNPRVMRKPKGVIVNGSVAILIPKTDISISDEQLLYFSSKEYREFYQVARNYQTRSLNVDSNSVYFYGILK